MNSILYGNSDSFLKYFGLGPLCNLALENGVAGWAASGVTIGAITNTRLALLIFGGIRQDIPEPSSNYQGPDTSVC